MGEVSQARSVLRSVCLSLFFSLVFFSSLTVILRLILVREAQEDRARDKSPGRAGPREEKTAASARGHPSKAKRGCQATAKGGRESRAGPRRVPAEITRGGTAHTGIQCEEVGTGAGAGAGREVTAGKGTAGKGKEAAAN